MGKKKFRNDLLNNYMCSTCFKKHSSIIMSISPGYKNLIASIYQQCEGNIDKMVEQLQGEKKNKIIRAIRIIFQEFSSNSPNNDENCVDNDEKTVGEQATMPNSDSLSLNLDMKSNSLHDSRDPLQTDCNSRDSLQTDCNDSGTDFFTSTFSLPFKDKLPYKMTQVEQQPSVHQTILQKRLFLIHIINKHIDGDLNTYAQLWAINYLNEKGYLPYDQFAIICNNIYHGLIDYYNELVSHIENFDQYSNEKQSASFYYLTFSQILDILRRNSIPYNKYRLLASLPTLTLLAMMMIIISEEPTCCPQQIDYFRNIRNRNPEETDNSFIKHFQIFSTPTFHLFIQKSIEANIYTKEFISKQMNFLNGIQNISSDVSPNVSPVREKLAIARQEKENKRKAKENDSQILIARLQKENQLLHEELTSLHEEINKIQKHERMKALEFVNNIKEKAANETDRKLKGALSLHFFPCRINNN